MSDFKERFAETEELLKLHDSLEPGLPNIPSPILEYARSKARLEALQSKCSSEVSENDVAVLREQEATMKTVANLMEYINQSHK